MGELTSALAGDPGVLTPGLGAEPAEPGRLLSHTHSAPGARPIGSCLRLFCCTISPLVPAYQGPVLGCPRDCTCPSCPAVEGAPEAMGMCRGFRVAPLRKRGNGNKSLHHHPALPRSSTPSAGLAPWPGGPHWALLNRASARRSTRPGGIPRAEGGRAKSGARGRGPAGVQGTSTGLAERRAGRPLWPLS